MTVLEALHAIRGLLSDPARWTAGAFALDRGGSPIRPSHPTAVRWCLTGAVEKVAPGLAPDRLAVLDALTGIQTLAYWNSITLVRLNDTIGHEGVLDLIDKAIAKEEAKSGTVQQGPGSARRG